MKKESGQNVYYELYVDVLFLVNFMMDYILLLLVRKMLKCSATHGRIFLGAMLGAALTCLVVVLPIPYAFIKNILFHGFINICMVQVGLKVKTIPSLIKAIFLLYIGSILMGGLLEIFRPYVKIGSLFLFLAIVGYYIVLGIWKFLSYMQRWNSYHMRVELCIGQKKHFLKGLLDTGNGLCDPITGKPVSIVDRSTANKLLGKEDIKNIRYIPYKTIGSKEGVMPCFQIDLLRIHGERECVIQDPLIGISEEKFSSRGECEMILNPNLF